MVIFHGDVKQRKTEIRKRIIGLLKQQKEEDRLRKSLVILEKLFVLPEFQCSKTILFYASFNGEVETFEMMKQAQQLGKRIALPMVLLKEKRIIPAVVNHLADLELGPYDIRQPRADQSQVLSLDEIDLLIVPGVAFDKKNNRLGRGAGYYDRFLESLPRDIPSIGLAFDFQIMESLPHQEHDVPVSRVIVNP